MDTRRDRLYRLIELLPHLPLWAPDAELPIALEDLPPVERHLGCAGFTSDQAAQSGLNPQAVHQVLQTDRSQAPLSLPEELLPQGRWFDGPEQANDPVPQAWWRLNLPVIGPLGTLLHLELRTPEQTHHLRFFSPRAGSLTRLQ